METSNIKNRQGYVDFIRENFLIVDKSGQTVPFDKDPHHWDLQSRFILKDAQGREIILKARQQGFSSIILGIFAVDFLAKPNSYSTVIADNADNAQDLLERVKFYLGSFEEKNKYKIQLKYNSKYELFNKETNSRYKIGSAESGKFGRSKTLTGLHFSEFAFYPNQEALLASALQALVPGGKVFIETTANGFNYFKSFWDEAKERGFNKLFYGASQFYDKDFLELKRKELKRLYPQEYPETPEEAFLASGDLFFDKTALADYLAYVQTVQTV